MSKPIGKRQGNPKSKIAKTTQENTMTLSSKVCAQIATKTSYGGLIQSMVTKRLETSSREVDDLVWKMMMV